MKLDGQLESAQLENISSGSPTPTSLGRMYADVTDPANVLPRVYDGTSWSALLKRKITYTSYTTTDTLGADIEYARCDASGAAFALTLPTAASMSGKLCRIHKIDSTFNAVTITGNGSEQIDGSNTSTLNSRGEWVILLSLGTSWTVIEWGYYEGKTSFTPTGSWSSNTTYTGYWYRVGNRICLEIHIALAGAPTSASLTINMPTGTTIDTAQLLSTTAGLPPIGYCNIFDTSGTDSFIGSVYYNSSSTISVKKDDGDGTVSVVNATAPITFASGDALDLVGLQLPVTSWRG